uniref:Uncharacterized protein n=1 Tax=Tetraselmis sp. GSL018 TaxID=582737 RepID=A0A061QSY9_9CHLO
MLRMRTLSKSAVLRGFIAQYQPSQFRRLCRSRNALRIRCQDNQGKGDAVEGSASKENSDLELDTSSLPENFCIIESPTAVKDFADMQLSEVVANIEARRNKIFLLMEEVRRLRIQERLKRRSIAAHGEDDAFINEHFPSALPFAPPLNVRSIKYYYLLFGVTIFAIIIFGGLVSPILEVRLGLGGQSYSDFIDTLHLPQQLSQVDPIVASFCGGAVGVLTSLLLVEQNNVRRQAEARCAYCEGTGYITCGSCFGGNKSECANCSGTGKVACTACLCTGKRLATEYDPRIDPFD